MYRKFFYAVLYVISGQMAASEALPLTVSGILERLDTEIDNREVYLQRRVAGIDSLKALLAESGDREKAIMCYRELGDAYCGFNVDSAVAYYSRGAVAARHEGDSVSVQLLDLLKAAILPLQGAVKEAVDLYGSYDGDAVYAGNKAAYYEAGSRMYFHVCSFYGKNEYRDEYMGRGAELTCRLPEYVQQGDVGWKLYQAQSDYVKGRYPMAVANLRDVLDETALDDNMYARAASMLAAYYMSAGKRDEAIYYYAASAVADVVAGTLEEISLQRLGVALYDSGDVSRAYRYLTLSLDNAVRSGSRIRAVEVSGSLPIIAQTFREQDQERIGWLTMLVACLVVALAVIAGITVSLRRGIGKRDRLRQRLVESNYVKESYISRFLDLSSIYIEKLEEFHKLAGRKIAAGQIEDLYGIIKSGKMLDDQSRQFYEVFDNAFIHIYPTFVDDVNALFHADKRMPSGDKTRLSTEFRILAFIRLGLDDSSQIARFLGLSLNTVYTYRNKMKSRAVNRGTFERDLMKIGCIS